MKMETMFDKAAGSYDKTEEVRFKQATAATIAGAKKHLKANDVVLDYGCGTGTKALELAGGVKWIHAIDISGRMIELAKRKAAASGVGNVDFARGDIFSAGFPKESFDVVTAFNVLHLLGDCRRAVRRIAELLKPGGLWISVTPCLAERMSGRDRLAFSLVTLAMKIGLFPPIARFTFPELAAMMAQGDFRIVESEKRYHGLSACFVVARKG